MLALSFAANEYQVTQESLAYKSNAISYINQKICCTSESSVSATIGAILLLIGVEASTAHNFMNYVPNIDTQWHLGAQFQVQIHLNGIVHLLRLYNTERIHLHDGIKRCVFGLLLKSHPKLT